MKIKLEEISTNLIEKERENKELSYEIKNQLQSFFETQNFASKLQMQLQEISEINQNLKDKISLLEKDKEILIQRIYDLGGDTDRSDN